MNAWRHADGIGQKVEFAMQGGSLVVSVSDRGCGFDPEAKIDNGRIGLAGLRERVQSVGGMFNVDTAPGRGTRLIMRLQIEQSVS
jgi:signal transduction histidine kinase